MREHMATWLLIFLMLPAIAMGRGNWETAVGISLALLISMRSE